MSRHALVKSMIRIFRWNVGNNTTVNLLCSLIFSSHFLLQFIFNHCNIYSSSNILLRVYCISLYSYDPFPGFTISKNEHTRTTIMLLQHGTVQYQVIFLSKDTRDIDKNLRYQKVTFVSAKFCNCN